MRRDRLAQLADFLEKLPPQRFFYRSFALSPKFDRLDTVECDSVGCALGWATAIFPELALQRGMWGNYYVGFRNDPTGAQDVEDSVMTACEFFEISVSQAQNLFTNTKLLDNFHNSEDELEIVIKNIRELIDDQS